MPDAFPLQGPGHGHLIERKADLGGHGIVDAEVRQGLAHVQVGLAMSDDAKAPLGTVDHQLVQGVGAGKGDCSGQFVLV